jgi:DNA-binding PadR family transcriptional regulator
MSKLSPDEVILGLLAHQSAHGYQLLDYFQRHFGHVWRLSTSQLYACLKRLESNSMIWGQEQPSYDAPTRTEYILTALGKLQLEGWLTEAHPSPSTRQIRTQFISRLHIAALLNKPTTGIIQAQVKACQQHLAALHALQQKSPSLTDQLALSLQISEQQAMIAWLEQQVAQDQPA